MNDQIILVNQADEILGFREKISCHLGAGVLHRAFSILIFNSAGQLLIQQRAQPKMLWPNFWSNTCCSHPHQGEDTRLAAERRLREEFGFTVPLKFLYKFIYSARFLDRGSENELCYVYVGQYSGPVRPDHNEILVWQWIALTDLDQDLQLHPGKYTPWFPQELARLKELQFDPRTI